MPAWLSELDGRDVVFVVGLASVSVGSALVYMPAGLIVAGVILILVAIFGVKA